MQKKKITLETKKELYCFCENRITVYFNTNGVMNNNNGLEGMEMKCGSFSKRDFQY